MNERHKSILAPSLLAYDHADLGVAAVEIESEGREWLHVDLMDGHFVPNLSFGPQTVADLRAKCGLFLDVHLMLSNPGVLVEAFAKSGADLISVHVETGSGVGEVLSQIRNLGCQVGIALNPDTPAEEIRPFLGEVDLVVVMTVVPGFGGQSFRQDMIEKINVLHRWREIGRLDFRLEVDGGVNPENAMLCQDAGADVFVAGTAYRNLDKEARNAFALSMGSA
ncbi:MAG: ribulose-phosphate 3-epimerase [Opitutae bacterium]|nr:ribulose-phosphate 3-epimerase [Opitutae bacterium]